MMGTYFAMPFMWIIPVFFLIVIILAVKQFTGGSNISGNDEKQIDPELILKTRFAKGDIEEEEYISMLAQLRK